VAAEGFKPGPMGSRGLGQLAYDKGMRILAASKSKDSAVERGGIDHGLLSYALVDEGLTQGLADFQPKDGRILMSEWLAYAEQEVPKLFSEGDSKGVIQLKGGPDTAKEIYHGGKKTPPQYQQPVLFDFNKHSSRLHSRPFLIDSSTPPHEAALYEYTATCERKTCCTTRAFANNVMGRAILLTIHQGKLSGLPTAKRTGRILRFAVRHP
jgi:hypothetical protein